MSNDEPVFERSVDLPFGYVFTARARPSSVRRTIVRLLPWAIVVAMPKGRLTGIARAVATSVSPMMKQNFR